MGRTECSRLSEFIIVFWLFPLWGLFKKLPTCSWCPNNIVRAWLPTLENTTNQIIFFSSFTITYHRTVLDLKLTIDVKAPPLLSKSPSMRLAGTSRHWKSPWLYTSCTRLAAKNSQQPAHHCPDIPAQGIGFWLRPRILFPFTELWEYQYSLSIMNCLFLFVLPISLSWYLSW